VHGARLRKDGEMGEEEKGRERERRGEHVTKRFPSLEGLGVGFEKQEVESRK
jgi:hypothetical protein